MFFILTFGRTKKCCVAKKAVVLTKKVFHIDVNVAYQNYVIHKKICCGDKKQLCDTQKKTHVS